MTETRCKDPLEAAAASLDSSILGTPVSMADSAQEAAPF